MTDRETMQQALEALEAYGAHTPHCDHLMLLTSLPPQRKPCSCGLVAAITALRERLAQPEMQPCAGRNCGSTNPNLHSAECFEDYEQATGMNQWQGLTDEEIKAPIQRAMQYFGFDPTQYSLGGAATIGFYGLAKEIEAKLREKNA